MARQYTVLGTWHYPPWIDQARVKRYPRHDRWQVTKFTSARSMLSKTCSISIL
ncbi:hypothetical protein BAUCODRAFT_453291 [Baudoinia panamericana UAMH 10762]|uniref:Uncharacterized protein n=1 Tax=Baudoinia panamericana (strain UAMH 10762) TaxID=717646 RepID=M2NET0_BAUPA|nr:uncharacterized protein BAUCODRAFT_453291 [Baudoinia panamericana UAMH 10762]EMC97470.1 hypothetical protein BAUCODRAFT_453291 [Baudoinia panamericana UAMH 10762]